MRPDPRWLAEQRGRQRHRQQEADARKLRLESDADLVKVVTVHKSKGLEYPLVFLPFATAFRPARPDDVPMKWHDDQGRLQVALTADDEALVLVDEERLGEDLRKLYVALTRARHATWVGVAPLAGVERSALGYLLGGGQPLSRRRRTDRGAARRARSTCQCHRRPACRPSARRCALPAGRRRARTWRPAPPLPAGPRESWWIASYSALSRAADTLDDDAGPGRHRAEPATHRRRPGIRRPGPATAEEDIYAESRIAGETFAADDDAAPATEARGGGLHGFPRGAGPGSFLHGLLEWVGRKGFARVHADADAQADLADLIARRCNLSGWSNWTEPLRAWLHGTGSAAPLKLDAPGAGAIAVSPASLGRVQIEMEFWLAAQHVDTRALDALVRRHTLGGAPRSPLLPQQLNGMLKGYIDLVFEHEGRYYVADYKSNWLGPRDADYTPAAMRAEVLRHRYELQYALYLFALHRLLRSRLPDYDYERHVGGAVYIFLRGHAAPGQGLHVERPPKAADGCAGCAVQRRGAIRPPRRQRHERLRRGADHGVFLRPLPALHAPLLAELDRWVEQGWLRALDRSFAAFLAQQAPGADPLLILGAALASHQLGRGHACTGSAGGGAAPNDAWGQALVDAAGRRGARWPRLAPPITAPSASAGRRDAGEVDQGLEVPGAGGGRTRRDPAGACRRPPVPAPLLAVRAVGAAPPSPLRVALPTANTAAPKPQATPGRPRSTPCSCTATAPTLDWQKVACAIAVRQGFSIITGGPGTGKTTTVVRLLAVLQHLGDLPRARDGNESGGNGRLRIR